MRRKVTLKQIAKELDVSISTVSKSLRDSPEISEDTRLKVQAFAKLYNYKPNNIALSLKNKKTKTIGIIIPEIVHHFFATVISGIEQVANECGYNVIVCLVVSFYVFLFYLILYFVIYSCPLFFLLFCFFFFQAEDGIRD